MQYEDSLLIHSVPRISVGQPLEMLADGLVASLGLWD